MGDCICGNPEGTNKECERCRLIATIERMRDELWRLAEVVSDEDAESIERCLVEQDYDVPYVSPEEKKRNDAMERGDYLRDRAKDEKYGE